MNKLFLATLLVAITFSLSSNLFAQEKKTPMAYVDVNEKTEPKQNIGTPPPITEMTMDGRFDVTLKKAKVQNDVLTIVLVYKNTGDKTEKFSFPLKSVYFIDNKDNKKYHVLKDEKQVWIAAPICGDFINTPTACFRQGVNVDAGKMQMVWFKFPAPPQGNTINIVIPDSVPFENIAIQ